MNMRINIYSAPVLAGLRPTRRYSLIFVIKWFWFITVVWWYLYLRIAAVYREYRVWYIIYDVNPR